MSDQPWYHAGLRFQCTGCGDCCTGAPGFVWVNKREMEALSAALGLGLDEFERQCVRVVGIRKSLVEHPNGDCVFFDNSTRQCAVYHARPRQCRTWPFWESNVHSVASWQSTCDVCPGCGHGHLYTAEAIREELEKRK